MSIFSNATVSDLFLFIFIMHLLKLNCGQTHDRLLKISGNTNLNANRSSQVNVSLLPNDVSLLPNDVS